MNDFYVIKETVLEIPGVTAEHRFLQISDSHILVEAEDAPEEVNAYVRKRENDWASGKEDFCRRFDQPFREEYRISNLAMFDQMLELARAENPECLLMTGDMLECMHAAGEKTLRQRLSDYGGDFICLPGNHEDAALAGVWDEGTRVFPFDGFRIIAVDDRKKTVTDETLSQLRDALSDGTPAIVLLHVPIANDSNREAMNIFSTYYVIDEATADPSGRELVRLLTDSPNVAAVLCGHVHGWQESELAPGKWQYCCSQSMSACARRILVRGK